MTAGTGASAVTVQIFDATVQDNRHIPLDHPDIIDAATYPETISNAANVLRRFDETTAGPDQHPQDPVTVFATTPPKAGTYLLHNAGKFTIGAPPLQTTFQMPKQGAVEIKNVAQSQTNDDQVNGPTQIITWDVVQAPVITSMAAIRAAMMRRMIPPLSLICLSFNAWEPR